LYTVIGTGDANPRKMMATQADYMVHGVYVVRIGGRVYIHKYTILIPKKAQKKSSSNGT